MANLSEIHLIGRLGKDPESRYDPNGKMSVAFSLAVNRRRGETERTVWYRCQAYGRLAETLDTLAQQGALVKGREVYVSGDFEPREYTANDGTARVSNDVFCDKVQLLGGRDDRAANGSDDSNEAPF